MNQPSHCHAPVGHGDGQLLLVHLATMANKIVCRSYTASPSVVSRRLPHDVITFQNTKTYRKTSLNPGFPSRFFSKTARQNPERKAWVRGYHKTATMLDYNEMFGCLYGNLGGHNKTLRMPQECVEIPCVTTSFCHVP